MCVFPNSHLEVLVVLCIGWARASALLVPLIVLVVVPDVLVSARCSGDASLFPVSRWTLLSPCPAVLVVTSVLLAMLVSVLSWLVLITVRSRFRPIMVNLSWPGPAKLCPGRW